MEIPVYPICWTHTVSALCQCHNGSSYSPRRQFQRPVHSGVTFRAVQCNNLKLERLAYAAVILSGVVGVTLVIWDAVIGIETADKAVNTARESSK